MLISKALNLHEVYLTLHLIRSSTVTEASECSASPSSLPNHYRQFQWNWEESPHYWCHFIFKCHICVKLSAPKWFCNSVQRHIFLIQNKMIKQYLVWQLYATLLFLYKLYISTGIQYSVIVIKIIAFYLKVKGQLIGSSISWEISLFTYLNFE